MEVFNNKVWNDIADRNGIVYYGYYHKYRLPDGSINADFYADKISGLILDVKDRDERGLNFFFNQLQGEIKDGVTICVVPGHWAGVENDSSIAMLARRLASTNDRIDAVDYIVRTKTISKLARGGSRDIDIQRESLGVNPDMSITGSVILLVDDVTTSGNSLLACKELLLKHGAKDVAMFALGKSI